MKWVTGCVYYDRENFADRYIATGKTFAIADGMGIGKGAVLSAEKAISLLKEFEPYLSEDYIRETFKKINKEIIKEIGKLGDSVISGTTLSLLSLNENKFLIGHIGDSRIYRLRKGKLERLTEDHVKYKGNKKIVRVLGLEWNPEIQTLSGELEKGDTFLLISDGFLNVISEGEIRDILLSEDLERSKETLKEIFRKRAKKGELAFIIVKP
ncbi:PP2C family protein-serine/threonine phosphatase [Aquifex sp.]